MTKFQLNRPDAPWDYPSLGFRANTGTAILDGSTFDPPITTPPDVWWTVYVGGSGETGITRYTFPVVPSSSPVEPNNGSFLIWDADLNRYGPMNAGEFFDVPEVTLHLNLRLDTVDTPTGVVSSTSTTGGSLAAATYSYRVSATNAYGETLASTATTIATTGATSTATVSWTASPRATGYKVYGRTGGTELLIATVGAVTTYTDTGAVTPAGALPATNTTASLDRGVQRLVLNTGGAGPLTSAALLGALVPREIVSTTPGEIHRLVKITSDEPDIAPFEIVNKEFVDNASGWPSNILTAIGYNSSEYLQNGSGDPTKTRNMLNFESGYYTGGVDGTYGPELYMDTGIGEDQPVGGTIVSMFRPLYIRPILGTGSGVGRQWLATADQYAFILFDIGKGVGGNFVVRAGSDGDHLFEISQPLALFAVPQIGMISADDPALFTIDGYPTSTVRWRCNSVDSYSIMAGSPDQLIINDKTDTAVVVFSRVDPESGLNTVDIRQALRVKGHFWVRPAGAGTGQIILDGTTGSTATFRYDGGAAFDFSAINADQLVLYNKASTPVAVWTYGASTAAALFDVRSSLKVQGNVGFYNTAPIAKQTLPAAASDLASVIVLANNLRAMLINLGLFA